MSSAARDTEVEAVIYKLLREVMPWQFAKKEIAPQLSLQNDLGIDSFGKAALAFRIEEELKIDVKDISGKVGEIRTVEDIVNTAKLMIGRDGA